MARRFRIFGKKRGGRRTGSERLGSFGELLFYAVILIMGAGSFYLLLTRLIWPEWQANRHFVAHECVVLDRRVHEGQDANGHPLYRPQIQIECEFDGHRQPPLWTYDINQSPARDRDEAREIIDEFNVGGRYVCWFNPVDRREIVLVRGYSWWMWLLLLIPASFAVLGTVGVARAALRSGISAERRAAIAGRAAQLDLFDDGEARGLDYPAVPTPRHMTDSPGTHLRYRLPLDASEGWKLTGMWLVALLWNGIVGWLVAVNLADHLAQQGSWLVTLTLLPFLVGGVALGAYCLRRLFSSASAGTTRVEISSLPLFPGETYDLYFSQSGRGTIGEFQLLLACDEKASYRQGTDTRTETQRSFEQIVYRRPSIEVGPERLFEDQCRVTVPAGAMHSFRSLHNEVRWRLIVVGESPRKQRYERQFPLVVYPSRNRQAV